LAIGAGVSMTPISPISPISPMRLMHLILSE
jgi:hypothetical protein